jgi:hypothetical protein
MLIVARAVGVCMGHPVLMWQCIIALGAYHQLAGKPDLQVSFFFSRYPVIRRLMRGSDCNGIYEHSPGTSSCTPARIAVPTDVSL